MILFLFISFSLVQLFKIQQEKEKELFKIQQERDELLKIQQERETSYSKSSKRCRSSYMITGRASTVFISSRRISHIKKTKVLYDGDERIKEEDQREREREREELYKGLLEMEK